MKLRQSYAHFQEGVIIAGSKDYELQIGIERKIIKTCSIIDKRTEFKYADGNYCYHLHEKKDGYLAEFNEMRYKKHSIRRKKRYKEIILNGQMSDLEIRQRYLIYDNQPFFDEFVTLENKSNRTLNITELGFGFTKKLVDERGNLSQELIHHQMIPIPYRQALTDGKSQDYSLQALLEKRGWYQCLNSSPSPEGKIPTPQIGSEGWVWTDGNSGLLLIKYSQEQMEHSLLNLEMDADGTYLRFGSCGIWRGDPGRLTQFKPGDRLNFGVTRYQLVKCNLEEGYRIFRSFMDSKGHITPEGFNPPVHWNELYDNRLWSGKDNAKRRKKFYQLKDMEEEAVKAKEIGCEALYLDPGWDTSFSSSIWAEDRLGKVEDFVKLMKEKYDLLVSLHTPLAGWCDASTYPRKADRMDKDGKILTNQLCSGSSAYIKTKVERLLKLAKAGVVYFMFDGSGYTGPCYHPGHKHPVPYTKDDHCRAYLKISQEIHRRYPKIIIEMHDMVIAGIWGRYCPTYFLHNLPYSYDEAWAFEYMWDPMKDLTSGRAISLYYYNLAYNLPLYLHIDLRKDNVNCLEFWWYASTVKHLGIGGRHQTEGIWEAHKRAMKEYLRLKVFYTQGIFYGLGEDVHVHTLTEKSMAVLNIFNLTGKPVKKEVKFRLEEVGLHSKKRVKITGASYEIKRDEIKLILDLSSLSPALVKLRCKQ